MASTIPVAGALGAEVEGIDLTRPVSDESIGALREWLLEYEVLFFRDQPIEPARHAALADRFGPPQTHGAYPHVAGFPQLSILENDEENPPMIDTLHADMTFRTRPPMGSILHGIEVPERGGDTLFVSTSAAFEGLSGPMQSFLSSLEAVHDFSHGFRESLAAPGGRERLAPMVRENPPVRHPVIRRHPESGRQGIFVNRLFTVSIVGMKPGESRALLTFLFEHLETAEFSCRFRWRPNSLAFWDNRIVQHRPINDYWPAHRRMQRITIDGDRPM